MRQMMLESRSDLECGGLAPLSPAVPSLRPESAKQYGAALLATVIAIAMPIVANACPVCFGNPNSPLSKGATNGVLFLLGIIGIVQIGFVALFITFWRRARAMKKFREQFQVIEGGVR